MTRNTMYEVLRQVKAGHVAPLAAKQILAQLNSESAQPNQNQPVSQDRAIAIIGMACRFGSANNETEYWKLLKEGRSSVREIPSNRWDVNKYYDPDPRTPNRTNSKWGSFLEDITGFDPLFFQLSGVEAERMDPQQRIILETCWTALEQAGWADSISGRSCGVFIGAPSSDYVLDSQRHGADADAQTMMGNDSAILAARISYLLNLRGPSIALNTACSSSLVATDLAVRAIQTGDCESAVVGGVCLFITPGFYISASKAGMLSPTGMCSTFDRSADGFVPGEGAGVLVLKDLDAALADGDSIRAVIRGSSTNQDGRSNGLTAPNSTAQSDLQHELYERLNINPASIEMIEAHGTGTPLGDPIEVEALTRSFRAFTGDEQFCAIGSAKTNIGHTGQAAGVAGIIKCVLALENQVIPRTLNVTQPNERINFETSPFFIADQEVRWDSGRLGPRRAAVSSFGYSGTNAHVLLEEAPSLNVTHSNQPQLFVLSAATKRSLTLLVEETIAYLSNQDQPIDLAGVSHTLIVGRGDHPYRIAVVADTVTSLVEGLEAIEIPDSPSVRSLGGTERRKLDEAFRQMLADPAVDRADVLAGIKSAFLKGYSPSAEILFPEGGRRVALPTYPFDRDHFWQGWTDTGSEKAPDIVRFERVSSNEQADVGTLQLDLTGSERFVADHIVAGQKVLAAMVSVELVRAGARFLEIPEAVLEQVTWHRPMIVTDDGLRLHLRYYSESDRIRFELGDTSDGSSTTVSGYLELGQPVNSVDVKTNRGSEQPSEQSRSVLEHDETYRQFKDIGITYGTSFRVLDSITTTDTDVIARLRLQAASAISGDVELYPALLDGGIQSLIATAVPSANTLHVPYSANRVVVNEAIKSTGSISAHRVAGGSYHIEFYDQDGSPLALIDELEIVAANLTPPDQNVSVNLYRPEWRRFEPDTPETNERAQPESVLTIPTQRATFGSQDRERIDLRTVQGFRTLFEDAGGVADHIVLETHKFDSWSPTSSLAPSSGSPKPLFDMMAVLVNAVIDGGKGTAANPVRISVLYDAGDPESTLWLQPFASFGQSLQFEQPFIEVAAVGFVPGGHEPNPTLGTSFGTEAPDLGAYRSVQVNRDGNAYFQRLTSAAESGKSESYRGTWVVTGGLGGVGFRLCKHLAGSGVDLAIIGRSPASETADRLGELGSTGTNVTYHQVDVGQLAELSQVLDQIRRSHGPIRGIVHAAAASTDSLLGETDMERAAEAIKVKAGAAIALDELTVNDSLDFFVVISSAVSWFGNLGQVTYGYANGVLDQFAVNRTQLVEQGERNGRTVSIAFTGWEGPGMAADLPNDQIRLLNTEEGLHGFDSALSSNSPNVVVLHRQQTLTSDELANVSKLSVPQLTSQPDELSVEADPERLTHVQEELSNIFAEELKIPRSRLEIDRPLEDYGIDSVLINRLSVRLEESLGPIPRTLFFEYQTVGEFAHYVVATYPTFANPSDSDDHKPAEEPLAKASPAAVADWSTVETETPLSSANKDEHDYIAIVGISGKFPEAEELEDFWQNLMAGRDSVTSIPEDRWSLDGFYDPEPQPHRSYSRWGGFLDDVARFDPVFFGIAPNEARMMDPQERLFLETVWQLLERSGYSKQALTGRDIGVFVGAMYAHYQLNGSDDSGRIATSSFASIANRISYYFDWSGPSLSVDTMCSSSLVALHMACKAIQTGDCTSAVVGGVNLHVHPQKYLQLSLGRFASSDGKCHSFGEDGDGYVPSEGVGALLLKPLSAARKDGDYVHAVVRGSAVNHGGKTNGYTVPNVRRQTDVIQKALSNSGIDPQEVGYVEAHGTGTPLGDPIEIEALNRAYAGLDAGSVPIGSVKSNIGHAESAAGIVAIAKVLLQMEHGIIAPSLHSQPPNPAVDFGASPFRVATEVEEWPTNIDGSRIASISSFGAGGTNSHIVLQSATTPSVVATHEPEILVLSADSNQELQKLADRLAKKIRAIVDHAAPTESGISVSDVQALVAEVSGVEVDDFDADQTLAELGLDHIDLRRLSLLLAEHAQVAIDLSGELTPAAVAASLTATIQPADSPPAPEGPTITLADLAYTLRVGRTHQRVRASAVVAELQDAVDVLAAVASGAEHNSVYRGEKPRWTLSSEPLEQVPADLDEQVAHAIENDAFEDIASLWVQGADVDWNLWPSSGRRRVPLVGYPFAGDDYWINASDPTQRPSLSNETTSATPPTETVPSGSADPLLTHDNNTQILTVITSIASGVIGLEVAEFDYSRSLLEYGFESVSLKDLAAQISTTLEVDLTPDVFFDHPNLVSIASWLEKQGAVAVEGSPIEDSSTEGPQIVDTTVEGRPVTQAERNSGRHAHVEVAPKSQQTDDSTDHAVAIIGMSGRFPQSPDLETFWTNLHTQRDLIQEVPADRWRIDDSENGETSVYKWGGFLADVDKFDPGFFGISPAEAEMMDPQQRLLLMASWHALEDAGYDPASLAGSNTGVFAGIQFSDYQHLLHESGVLNAHAALGSEHSISVNRISYLLDFHGPSEPVNTACSSALVAVHRAMRSLRTGESSLALAGGIALNLASHSTMAAGMMGLLSPDGRCKTLSAAANGYVKGEGCGIVVLKRLDDAIADGDTVLAVMKGSAVNHGGKAASITAPNADAQAALIRTALDDASLSAQDISYIELHGTGTELGDPIEIRGIKQAFNADSTAQSDQSWCGISSVKTNVGHLEPASGIAGLMKVVLSLQKKTLPGIVHCDEVNPYINLDGSPLYIVDETQPWTTENGSPLRAGVSSFGFGGVNAHVIVEESLQPETATNVDAGELLFVFSAQKQESLQQVLSEVANKIRRWDSDQNGPRPVDVAYTLQIGRKHFEHRTAVVASSLDDLRQRIEASDHDDVYSSGDTDRAENVGSELRAQAQAWVTGEQIEWPSLEFAQPRRVSLPGYRFATNRYWFDDGFVSNGHVAVVQSSNKTVIGSADDPITSRQPVEVASNGTAASTATMNGAATNNVAASDTSAGSISATGSAVTSDVEGTTTDLDHLAMVRDSVLSIVAGKLRMEPHELDLEQTLVEYGIDSMFGASILQELQGAFNVELGLNELVEESSIDKLARSIAAESTEQPTSPQPESQGSTTPKRRTSEELITLQHDGDQVPSFWVHGAPGYSTWFRNLSTKLGPDYPMYAFQARGTDGSSLPHTFDEMVDCYVENLLTVRPNGPYILGGYSFGGLVAMEMAKKLDDAGQKVSHLVMLDTYPATTEVFERHVGIYADGFLQTYLANYFLKIDENPEKTITMDDLDDLPQSLHLPKLARLTAERSDSRMSEDDIFKYLRGGILCSEQAEGSYQTYQMSSYQASDVLFFKATDGFTGKASAAYWKALNILEGYDYVQPWRDVVSRNVELVDLDTDHMNMLEGASLDRVTQHVGDLIGDISERTRTLFAGSRS